MHPSPEPSFAVVIPTWRRPDQLLVCLRALAAQRLPPTRVLVAAKVDDESTSSAVAGHAAELPRLRIEAVVVPPTGNFRTQLSAGVAATTEPFVAITDDDAEPHPDWLSNMARHFEDPNVGGVGGRDWLPDDQGESSRVGEVSWYGRIRGNHHIGVGPARAVDVLKGVNWAFRGDLIREVGFDPRMRGRATVTHTELALCFAVRKRGWKLVYDPQVGVDHHVAPRLDGNLNSRGGFDARSFSDSVHNETLALLEFLPPVGRAAFLAWAACVGTWEAPGLAQVVRLLARRRPDVAARWSATVAGRVAGVKSYFGWGELVDGAH